jgi:hypothetical protein
MWVIIGSRAHNMNVWAWQAAEGRVVQIEEGRLLRILPYTVTREGVVKDEGRCIIGLGRPKVRVGPLTLRRGLGMGHEEDQRVTYVSDSLRVCRLHDGHGMVAFKKQVCTSMHQRPKQLRLRLASEVDSISNGCLAV